MPLAPQYQAAAGFPVEPVGKGRQPWEAEPERVKILFKVLTTTRTFMDRNTSWLVDNKHQRIPVKDALNKEIRGMRKRMDSAAHAAYPIAKNKIILKAYFKLLSK